jgi:hypothetical protein
MNSRYNLEILNAYVDGELSAREKAEVANAIASNPDLARQAATLSSLKASLAASNPGDQEQFNFELPRKHNFRPRLVAAIAGLMVIGAVIAFVITNTSSLLPNQGLLLAEQAHNNWLQEEIFHTTNELHQTSTLIPENLQIDAYVPDLSKVDLVFNDIRRISSGNTRGMHIGYKGPSGCMVSLVVLSSSIGLSSDLTYFEKDGHLLYGWQVSQTGFYLLAHKMDPARLSKVARVVNRLTLERLPIDPESIIALNNVRTQSEPCLS